MNTWIRAAVTAFALIGLGASQAAAAEPTEKLRWFGDASSATGAALGPGSCDVNGDSYDDAVVGAWFWDKGATGNTGAAYVLFGGPAVNGGDLNIPGAAGAARIDGPSVANEFAAFAVACLGDVNGDDIDDIGISNYPSERGFVVLGAEEFGSPDLGLLGDRGFKLNGDISLAYNLSTAFGPAGDVNDDGLDDIAVAGIVADTNGRTNNGRVWIVAGKEDVADVDLINPEPGEVLARIDGGASEDRLGQGGIAPVGDMNDDGIEDFSVGAYTATPWGTSAPVAGSAWVLFGGISGDVDLNQIRGNDPRGFAIYGPQRGRDRMGTSTSAIGDVNDDGFDDLLVGGDGVFNAATGERPGSAWVIYGSGSPKTVYTATAPAATNAVYSCANESSVGVCTTPADEQARGYWIKGADSSATTTSESTGFSLSGIGDINNDEIGDFAIGAWAYDPPNPAAPTTTLANAGAVWVVYGKSDTTTQDLATLTAAQGYRLDGLAAGDRFGRQAASVGDLDGNGTKDFAGGADMAQRPLAPGTPRTQAGEVMVALMGELVTEVELENSASGPVDVGDQVTLDATVSKPAGAAHVVGQGALTFTAGGEPIGGCEGLTLVDGSAQCSTTLEERGGIDLQATYSGVDGTLKPASSEPASQLVIDDSGTALSVAPNPVLTGDQVTLTASVAGAAEGAAPVTLGTVDFALDGNPVAGCEGVAVNDGQAVCQTSPATAATRQATATYSGATDLNPSASEATALVVNARPVVEEPKGDPPAIERVAGKKEIGKKGKAGLMTVDCPAGSGGCTVTAEASKLEIGDKKFKVKLTVPSPLADGASGEISVKLKANARRALEKEGKGTLEMDVTVTGADGQSANRTGPFTLRPNED